MPFSLRSEEHTSELQSRSDLVCRLLLEKKTSIHPARRIRPMACLGPTTRPTDPISIPPAARCKAYVEDRVRTEHREDDLTGAVHEAIREVHGVLSHIESMPDCVSSDGKGDRRGRDRG